MQRGTHMSHPSFFHFILNKELDELYISIAFRFFALSMIGIFLPIYLLIELGFSLQHVMCFFIIFALIHALASFAGAKLAARIGFKHLILLSVPFSIAFFLLLLFLPLYNIPLWLVATVGAASNGLYWIGHHSDLAKFTVKKARGEEVGLSFFVHSSAMLVGPLVGGLILTYFNFAMLFIVASFFLLISTAPLFFSKDFYKKSKFSLRKVFKRRNLKDAIAFTVQGIEIGTIGVIWPIFIFFILGKYLALGLIGTFSALFAAISSIIVGKASDKIGKRNILRYGAFLLAALWIFKTLVKTLAQVYAATVFIFIRSTTNVPMDSLAYSKARTSRRIEEYLVFREFFISIGRVISYMILLFTASYITSFIFTGISQLALLLF